MLNANINWAHDDSNDEYVRSLKNANSPQSDYSLNISWSSMSFTLLGLTICFNSFIHSLAVQQTSSSDFRNLSAAAQTAHNSTNYLTYCRRQKSQKPTHKLLKSIFLIKTSAKLLRRKGSPKCHLHAGTVVTSDNDEQSVRLKIEIE